MAFIGSKVRNPNSSTEELYRSDTRTNYVKETGQIDISIYMMVTNVVY
jgi:hypothetical protein